MANHDSERLLEQLRAVVRDRRVPSLRPLIEGNGHDRRRLESHATAELAAIEGRASDNLSEIANLTSRIQGEQALAAVASRFLRPPVRVFNVTVSDGCRLIGTPFDHDWHMGLGMPLSRIDGHVFVMGADDGQSAAGVAIDLESDTQLDILFTPLGDYDFSAFAVQDKPGLRCRGGLGITAFEGGDAAAVFSRTVELFQFNSPRAFSGVHAQGSIAGAASPTAAGMFGPVTLAPVFLRLNSGRRLQVWVWAWILTAGAKEIWASILLKMPAATVCAGPPIIIR